MPPNPWRWVRRGVILLVIIAASAWAVENWVSRGAWTRFQKEWTAKGERFNWQDLVPPTVNDSENFLTAFFEATRATSGPNPNGTLDLTGIPPGLKNGANFKLPQMGSWREQAPVAVGEWAAFLEYTGVLPAGGTNNLPGAILAVLEGMSGDMDSLRNASTNRARAWMALRYQDGFNMLLPHLGPLRTTARTFALSAIVRLAADQPAAAAQDLWVVFRLADSITDEPLLVSGLSRIAMHTMALQVIWDGLATHKWTDSELVRIEDWLRSHDMLADYLRSMRGELAFGMATIDLIKKDPQKAGIGVSDEMESFAFQVAPAGLYDANKINLGLAYMNYALPTVDTNRHRVFPAVAANLEHFLQQGPVRTDLRRVLVRMLMPALMGAARKSAMDQSGFDMAHVACALERYRLVHGRHPETLQALSQGFMKSVPNDIMNGEPLRYELLDDGSFVLYSVGWNGRDDRGEIVYRQNGKEIDFDEGDWVWRYPDLKK
jgi:hypothetical protein